MPVKVTDELIEIFKKMNEHLGEPMKTVRDINSRAELKKIDEKMTEDGYDFASASKQPDGKIRATFIKRKSAF